jgi:hypothetical protein
MLARCFAAGCGASAPFFWADGTATDYTNWGARVRVCAYRLPPALA